MNGAQPRPFGAESDEELLFVLAFVGVFLLVFLVVVVFFLLTLHRCLNRCSPRNRTMEPGHVWLNLVPCLNIVWQFVTVSRMRDSLRNEFESRRLRTNDDTFAYGFGLASILIGIVSNVISKVGDATGNLAIDLVSFGLGLLGLGLGIAYWVKIAGYSRMLAEDDDRYDRRGDRDDEYDDRPRRRSSRDDEYEDDDRPRRRPRYDDEDDDRR